MGIPDVAVQRQKSVINSDIANVVIALPTVQAVRVTVPMPETVREMYLEVREVATREVVTEIRRNINGLDYTTAIAHTTKNHIISPLLACGEGVRGGGSISATKH